MRYNRRIHISFSVFFILLLIFPPFYQSAHQVWSHHHHFESASSSKGFLLDAPQDHCQVVTYIISNSVPILPVFSLDGFFVFLVDISTSYKHSLTTAVIIKNDIRGPPEYRG